MAFPRKRFSTGFILFALTLAAQKPDSIDSVVAAYASAVGGVPAVDAITSRKVVAGGLLGKTELYWQKPNKVLMIAGRERTGFDGSRGWFYSKRKKVTRLPQGQQMPLEIDGNPLRYVHLRQLYSDIELRPQKTIDDTLMDVLVAPNDLAQTTFYFDAHSHLLARIEEKGETSAYSTQTVVFDDYRSLDGVLFPFRISHKSSDAGAGREEFRVKSVENNVTFDAEIFTKPQSKKLVFGGKR